jgi:hypothetical protein
MLETTFQVGFIRKRSDPFFPFRIQSYDCELIQTSAVNIYNGATSLVRFEYKIILVHFDKAL